MIYKIVDRKTGDFEYRRDVAYCFESDHDIALFARKSADGRRDSVSSPRDRFDVTLVAADGPVRATLA